MGIIVAMVLAFGTYYWLTEKRLAVLTENNAKLSIAATTCLLYTSPSPRDRTRSRMPSSA